jgi:hypothetical protein
MKTLFLLTILFLYLYAEAENKSIKINAINYFTIASFEQPFNPPPIISCQNNTPDRKKSLDIFDNEDLSGLVENVYGLVYVLDTWAKKQTFWKMGKGPIISLKLNNNPIQIMPSMSYNIRDNHKNRFVLVTYLWF